VCRLWTHHWLQITDQLFRSNLTFCVVCVFALQTDKWGVHNWLFNANFDGKFKWTPDTFLKGEKQLDISQQFVLKRTLERSEIDAWKEFLKTIIAEITMSKDNTEKVSSRNIVN
jgi:hypothetical protein